jgi:hypothetical protein
LYLALIVPVTVLHELGHVYVCSEHGYQSRIWIDATGGHSQCFGRLEQIPAFNAMGGLFGLAGSGAIIAVWLAARKHVAILVVGLAYSVDQTAKIILEGFFTSTYLSGSLDFAITALQIASWFGFMFYFARRPSMAISQKEP